VKEAERSLLIFNLDMGQSPIMNPGTISAKVTVGLLSSLANKEKGQAGNYSQDEKDIVDDIINQVVRMEFFGSKTAPCKFPNDKARNGEFYTVPVKMVFKDRKTAQTAADLLRTYFKIYPTTPYHKSLRAASVARWPKLRPKSSKGAGEK
jgi:ferredoxin-thioredoxin reductase catalytic subunit